MGMEKKKLVSSNDRKPIWGILDMPGLVKNKKISLLSLKQREKRNAELEEAQRKTAWVHKAEKILLTHSEKIKYISVQLELMEKRKEKTEEAFKFVYGKLKNLYCNTLKEKDTGEYYLLGWQAGKFNSMVLLQDVKDREKYKFIYANTRLEKYLKLFKQFFNQKELKINKTIKFYRPINNNYTDYFILNIEEKQRFLKGNVWLEYFPIYVNTNINTKIKTEIEKILKEEKEVRQEAENLFLEKIEAPDKTKNADKCTDLEEGEYKIIAYSQTKYRGNTKTVLYVERLDKTKKEYLVNGYWIEEEVKKIEENKKLNKIGKPVVCRLGMVKTTPNKRKARTCTICYN